MTERPPHMSVEEFRRRGYQTIDWLCRYYERIGELPVLSRVEPGWVRSRLPPAPPERSEDFDHILADLDRIVVPALTHWQAPGFFAFFPANASAPAILGDLVSSGLGVQGMLWATSPACTELETHVLDWLVELLGLPARFRSDGAGGGVIQDTASSATLCALLAARERADRHANDDGVSATHTVYASAQAHSSVEKALGIAGLGRRNLRLVAVDDEFAMRPAALAEALAADRAAGRLPTMAVATIGTTSSTAIDPLAAIADLCRREGVWLHVDAAHAGSAAVCPELRWIHDGLEGADSYCFNPHKWLLTNFDCDCFYVADRGALIRALTILPEYLRNRASESGAVIDYRDWQVPLGRRFRALKLWFVIRHYGAEGLRQHIRRHLDWARAFADRVAADPDFTLAAPVPLNLVCFRHLGGDAVNEALLERVNGSGEIYLTHTRLGEHLVLRLAVGGVLTERHHVERAWHLIRAAAGELAARADRPRA